MKCYHRCAFSFSLAAWMKMPLLFKVIALWEYDNNGEDVQCEDKMQTNVPFKKHSLKDGWFLHSNPPGVEGQNIM